MPLARRRGNHVLALSNPANPVEGGQAFCSQRSLLGTIALVPRLRAWVALLSAVQASRQSRSPVCALRGPRATSLFLAVRPVLHQPVQPQAQARAARRPRAV